MSNFQTRSWARIEAAMDRRKTLPYDTYLSFKMDGVEWRSLDFDRFTMWVCWEPYTFEKSYACIEFTGDIKVELIKE